ncbi:MAG: hypothetical protein JST32_00050 [Bacteroidetes bacterium]|nr:hypothetical protein [Bacteroidota bacterium]
MKRDKRNIIIAWIVMVCFFAGQWAVYAHQHKTFPAIAKASHHGTSLTEKCQLCDAMHHTSAVQNVFHYTAVVTVTERIFIPHTHSFVSISLILTTGRAPPVS